MWKKATFPLSFDSESSTSYTNNFSPDEQTFRCRSQTKLDMKKPPEQTGSGSATNPVASCSPAVLHQMKLIAPPIS